jgi:hypothetical protein
MKENTIPMQRSILTYISKDWRLASLKIILALLALYLGPMLGAMLYDRGNLAQEGLAGLKNYLGTFSILNPFLPSMFWPGILPFLLLIYMFTLAWIVTKSPLWLVLFPFIGSALLVYALKFWFYTA